MTNWYKKAMLKTAWKFATQDTYTCGHCQTTLKVRDVTFNPNHHFNPGQLYKCACGKSQVWANSIRYPKELIDYCDGNPVSHHLDPEVWGFCNDEFCPLCWRHFHPLKTGAAIPNSKMHIDIYGCDDCAQNKSVWLTGRKDGEYDGQKNLAIWYKDNQDMWRNKIK